jgi:beta-lactamase superfamily II metal-dependent hydrolase
MAPHHGSLTAKANLLVDWCNPKVILISCSDRINTKRAIQYFAGVEREILLTSRDHAMRAIISQHGRLTLQRWQDGRWVTTKSLDK